MRKFSNTYIFIYITVIVVAVATLLSLAATLLRPYREANIKNETMAQILTAANYIHQDKKEIPHLFSEVATESEVGDIHFFSVNTSDGRLLYVVPVAGKGLWGPIWGYIALSEDLKTVEGAVFSHKSETPGLGGEIAKDAFSSSFKGKSLFDEEGNFISIKVVKTKTDDSRNNEVDALSGATITSRGVEEMLYRCLPEAIKAIQASTIQSQIQQTQTKE
ncbi:MAG: NADH:ubiquinone reductase (Na(+)-transporting) subunit C [Bacteroidales bacterium]|nr:NADH:ubiquinone reductase (Na(+)-transporting) subunit C [Bacteroidales bacterium]